ncbi:TonB-dependent receptor plug domain-containing protein [Microbulbifer taiwanensis]|uniref:TonB-dependent receptor plug domain-containing protein n=1 Tax=Microbulbifer taiwanensis TaxID=986746 RepID=UPI00361A74AD
MKKREFPGANYYSDVLRTSASALVLFAVIGAAQAQTDAVQEGRAQGETIEEIEVVGIRSTLERNLDIKRDAVSFVDAITAEDVGKFPDKNVADALQRVPGVSITRSGGEGQFVSIRGTSSALTLTQLNGNYIATASTSRDPQRSFNFALLPANLLERTEVYKTPEAKIDEGGLGGTIIVHTRRPLNMESGTGFLNFEETYADVTGEMEPQYSGLYSWKNAAENFGVLVSYTSQERTSISEESPWRTGPCLTMRARMKTLPRRRWKIPPATKSPATRPSPWCSPNPKRRGTARATR